MGEQPKKKSGIFASLSDDLLGQVVNKVKDKQERKSFSEVCKQWLKVEGLDRSYLTLYVRNSRPYLHALTRFPNILDLWVWNCRPHTDLEFIAQTCPKIERIMLECRCKKQNGDDGGESKGFGALGQACPKLSRVEMYGANVIGDSGVVELISSAHNLECLLLMSNELISDEALRGIGSSSSISILELANCDNITDEGLSFLANGSSANTLKKLTIGCHTKCEITDTGVESLRKMGSLEHLELSVWSTKSQITDIGGFRNRCHLNPQGIDIEFSGRVRQYHGHACSELPQLGDA